MSPRLVPLEKKLRQRGSGVAVGIFESEFGDEMGTHVGQTLILIGGLLVSESH